MSSASLRVAALHAYTEGKPLGELPHDDLTTLAEVAALLSALDVLLERVRRGRKLEERTLFRLAAELQNIDFAALSAQSGEVPEQAWHCANRLADVCEALCEHFNGPELRREHLPAEPDEFAFACKVLALFAHPRLPNFMRAVADQPALHDEYLWEIMFRSWLGSSAEYPERLLAMSDALAGLRARKYLRVCFLDYANALAYSGVYEQQERPHPFDSAAGEKALAELLAEQGEKSSYAVSAAATLPFVASERREKLLPVAEAHSDPLVRLEANYALARVGEERGISALAEALGHPELEARAHHYLTELGRQDLLDPVWNTEDGRARRQILNWLAHPDEFGRSPDHLEVRPAVTLVWPPSGETLPLRVFRYRYDGEESREGQGLHGSVLFALRRPTAQLTPEEVLALHCSWEIAQAEGRDDFSVEDGWARLAAQNPSFKPRSTGKKGLLARLFRA